MSLHFDVALVSAFIARSAAKAPFAAEDLFLAKLALFFHFHIHRIPIRILHTTAQRQIISHSTHQAGGTFFFDDLYPETLRTAQRSTQGDTRGSDGWTVVVRIKLQLPRDVRRPTTTTRNAKSFYTFYTVPPIAGSTPDRLFLLVLFFGHLTTFFHPLLLLLPHSRPPDPSQITDSRPAGFRLR